MQTLVVCVVPRSCSQAESTVLNGSSEDGGARLNAVFGSLPRPDGLRVSALPASLKR
jgi:hypothetical protein